EEIIDVFIVSRMRKDDHDNLCGGLRFGFRDGVCDGVVVGFVELHCSDSGSFSPTARRSARRASSIMRSKSLLIASLSRGPLLERVTLPMTSASREGE